MKMRSYSEILDDFGVIRHKCKCCGKDIIYDNSEVWVTYDNKLKYSGKSFNTIKRVNDVEYKLLVCQDCLLERFPNITNTSRIFNVMCDATKFAFDIPDDVFISSRTKYAMTREHMIEKYGERLGVEKWNEYVEKQRLTNTFEYKQSTYGWSKDDFDEYNKSRGITKKNLIKKYGEQLGVEKWNEYVEKQRLTKSWPYMVEKYGEERAREINRSKSQTLENLIKKYGEEEGLTKWKRYINNKRSGFSKMSQDFFKKLDKYISHKYTTQYASKGGEKTIYRDGHAIHLDYYIPELKLCVEFNGGCFHGDHRIYNDDDRCNPFDKSLTAKEIRERDNDRYEYLQNTFGIRTVVVWELDYDEYFEFEEFITDKLNIEL